MPQLDFVAFFSQTLSLAILSIVIITLALVYVLPNLISILKVRHQLVTGTSRT